MAAESTEQTITKGESDQLVPPADTPAQLPWPNASEQPTESPMFYQQSTSPPPVDASTQHSEHHHQPSASQCTPPQAIQLGNPIGKPHDSLPDVSVQSVVVQHVPEEVPNHVEPGPTAATNHIGMQVAAVSEVQPHVEGVTHQASAQIANETVQVTQQVPSIPHDIQPHASAPTGEAHSIPHQVQPAASALVHEVPPQVVHVSHQVQPHVADIPQVVDVPQEGVRAGEVTEGAHAHEIQSHVAGVTNESQPSVTPIVTPLESQSVAALDPAASGASLHSTANGTQLNSQGVVTAMESDANVANLDSVTSVPQLESAPNVPDLDVASTVQELDTAPNATQIEPSPVVSQLDGAPGETAMHTTPVVTVLDTSVPPVTAVEATSAASMPPSLDHLDKQPASATVPALEPLDSKSLTVAPLHVLEKPNIAGAHHAHSTAPKQHDAAGDVIMSDAGQHNGETMDHVQTSGSLIHGLHAPMTDAHAQGTIPSSSAVPATVATSATATPVVSSAPIVVPSTGPAGGIHSVGLSSGMVTPGLGSMVSSAQPSLVYAQSAGNTHHAANYGNGGQPMELHENGNLLTGFANAAEHVENIGQTAVQAVNVLGTQGMPLHVTQNGATTSQPVRVLPNARAVDPSGLPMGCTPVEQPRKPQRLPGTKQCPTCQGIIAAAVAKCPKCGHVFREKKQKPKRSGKRGKKNCPKCGMENPSACSTCKNPECKYIFRLKLMDRYKQMRPRAANGAAATQMAVPAASAGIVKQQTQVPPPMPTGPAVTAVPPAPISASAAIPAAGVQQYHPTGYAPLQMQAQPAPAHQLPPHSLQMAPATVLPAGTVVATVGAPGTSVGASIGSPVGAPIATTVGPSTNMAPPPQTLQTHAPPTQPTQGPSTPIQQHHANALPLGHTHTQNHIHHQGSHPQI